MDVGGEGTDAVERRGKGDQAVTRNATVAGHHGGNSAQSTWLPYRAAGVGAEGCHGEARGNRRSRASTGAARHAIRRFRVAHWTVGGVFVGAAHRKLIAIGLAEDDGAGSLKALNRSGVIRRNVVFEDFRSASGAYAAGADNVLYGDGHASKGWQRLASSDERVHAIGLSIRAVVGQRQIGVQFGVAHVDPLVIVRGEFARRNLFRG